MDYTIILVQSKLLHSDKCNKIYRLVYTAILKNGGGRTYFSRIEWQRRTLGGDSMWIRQPVRTNAKPYSFAG